MTERCISGYNDLKINLGEARKDSNYARNRIKDLIFLEGENNTITRKNAQHYVQS